MKINKKQQGATLIELLLALAIIGVLVSVAYPSYSDFVLRSNRTEGQSALLNLANLQEQLFVDSRAYTADMTALGMDADPYVTENGYYSIDAAVNGATFVLTATAKKGQVKDTGCTSLTINHLGEKTPASGCWEN